jgi:hypothetical protein
MSFEISIILGVAPNQVAELVWLCRFRGEAARAPSPGSITHAAGEDQLDLVEIQRLGQIIVGAALHCSERAFHVLVRRNDDDVDLGSTLAKPRQQLEPAGVRHPDIGDDDRRIERLQQTHGRLGALGHRGRISQEPKLTLEALANRPIVVDDDNALSHPATGSETMNAAPRKVSGAAPTRMCPP